jgi:hypothetical protein
MVRHDRVRNRHQPQHLPRPLAPLHCPLASHWFWKPRGQSLDDPSTPADRLVIGQHESVAADRVEAAYAYVLHGAFTYTTMSAGNALRDGQFRGHVAADPLPTAIDPPLN